MTLPKSESPRLIPCFHHSTTSPMTCMEYDSAWRLQYYRTKASIGRGQEFGNLFQSVHSDLIFH